MKNYQIDSITFNKWFTATTKADPQLKKVIKRLHQINKYASHKEISNTLFQCDNVFDHFKFCNSLNQPMRYESHISEKTINMIISRLGYMPKMCVEVGSFIGSSALVLGNMMKKYDGVLLCIDTWCGDINMWLFDKYRETMDKMDGNPKIFDRFMLNIKYHDLTNTVIPLRVSSTVGARMLKVLNYEIDVVYIDSAHEAGETFMELSLYHDLLVNNGILIGDDYDQFPAVKYDVDLFCKLNDYKLTFTGDRDTWLIQKTI